MRRLPAWTLAVSSVAIFMVSLDNLVVTNALTSIREDLGASIEALEWTVNAYTLAFAVFLLTGAALGDRFGRRRMFLAGLAIFTTASALAALAPSTGALIGARALQGLGGAILAPLSLTLLSTAAPAERRGLALGIWSGVSGLGVALGPLVGGAVIEGISWQWIFWLNVPVGLALAPLAARRLEESHGPAGRLDLPGLVLASAGLLGVVYGIVRGNPSGWASTEVVASIATGAALLAAFVAWELGSRPLMATGLFLQAIAIMWIAAVSEPDVAYGALVPAFVMGGTGMALVFAPAANAVLGAVRPEEAGQASGANNAIRELGGVLGVAVLAAVFTGAGGFETPQAFVDGLVPALWAGAGVLVAGGLAALLIPGKRRAPAPVVGPLPEPAAA